MSRKLVSFDWAMKRLLRSKANFDILEGFLSELLRDDLSIVEILESESTKDRALDKANRVDVKVRDGRGAIILIEVQYERQYDYLQRILFGTSRVVTEHLGEGDPYRKVAKVISVSILFFDLGQGKDYVYRGTTNFRGLHHDDELELSPQQVELYGRRRVFEVFPEYYLIKVNQFDDVARDTLDEWIYFLKHEEVKEGFKARGLAQAKERLDVAKLPEAERLAYEQYVEDLSYQASLAESSFGSGRLQGRREGIEEGHKEGVEEGRKEGVEEGRKEGVEKGRKEGVEEGRKEGVEKGRKEGRRERAVEIARSLLDRLDDAAIAEATGLSDGDVASLRSNRGEPRG